MNQKSKIQKPTTQTPTTQEPRILDFLHFIEQSPTAWHAVCACRSSLLEKGFEELHEQEAWHIKPGGRYFVTRNGSSLCAFIVPKDQVLTAHIVAAHTDSPSLKLKPNCEYQKENMLMLGCEVYGSPMLNSWLNRDLGIAGRVIYLDEANAIQEKLVRLETSVVIPQLAIHLDRSLNENGLILNKQEHLAALAGIVSDPSKKESFLERHLKTAISFKKILGSDLFLYPQEPPRLIADGTLLSSYRIDNLQSVHAAFQALFETQTQTPHLLRMVICWDNEEIGSNTPQGASSPFFPNIMERIALALNMSREEELRLHRSSLCVSVDMAHALHPNHTEKHEPRHFILLNQGIVIKTNAQHRYASDAKSIAVVTALCTEHHIPYQLFASRNDIPCGTTIGPIHATLTGIPTVDIGCAQLSMHSARELMSCQDHLTMIRLLKEFLISNDRK